MPARKGQVLIVATILIVDDRPANREFMVALLGYAHHRLLQASDGAEALALARAERPDLVIADILMPTMDGYELVRQLRADPRILQTRVIFWTAHYHEQEAKALARDCGVSAVITKPSEPEEVLKAVEAALRLTPVPAPPQTSTDEFDREHLRLLTDKLSQKADDLIVTNERLSALIDLNLQLASELDLQRLIQRFGRAARLIIGARYSITAILDADGEQFQSLFTSGMDAETAARLGSQDPQSAALNAPLREGATIRLRNPSGDPLALGFSSSHPLIHAFLGAPIASPTRLYGYVGLIDRMGRDEFSKEDERLTAILAAQVGRIYQNGSLYSDVLSHAADLEREISARKQTEKARAERVRQGALIGEVDAALTQSDSQGEMLVRCAKALVRHLDAALARIWTFNDAGSSLELKASATIDTDLEDFDFDWPEAAIARMAHEQLPYFANDVLNERNVGGNVKSGRVSVLSFAGYPLMVESRFVGALGAFTSAPLSGATLDVIGAVAPKIALGIERFRASETLREREEHIRLLLDSTAEAIYGIDLEGRCTFANSTCARLLGYADTKQLLGRNMHSLIHHTRSDGSPYESEECRIFRAFRQNQGVHVHDEVLWRSDGSSFPAEYWSHPISHDGRVAGSVVTFLDITERRKLEGQFRHAQERLSRVVVSSPAVLFTLSITQGEFSVSWISDNLLQVIGYPAQVAIGTDWWQTNIHAEDRERVMEQSTVALIADGQSTLEYRFRHGDGTYHWTRSDMRLICDESGWPSEVVGAWSDITELKRAEEERLKLREQLEQIRKLESIGQFAGGIAHDFNNLLGVIIGSAEMLQSDLPRDSNLREYTADVLNASQRGAELTRQILAFSRQQVLQPTVLSLTSLVQDFEKMLCRIIPKNIEIRTVLKSVGQIRADAGQIEQVIMNLVANARDAMTAGGRLTIETADVELDDSCAIQLTEVEPGPYAVLSVTDSGHGMTPDVLARIFEPFYTTKERGKGTGLGLGTVHGIVKQSGGSIYVYSEIGRGTTFKVYLPRLGNVVEIANNRFRSGHLPQGNETILVVEDEPSLRNIVSAILKGLGYSVLVGESGEDALRASSEHNGPIHLLVTDVVMPGIGGRELADRLTQARPELRVIYMSGYTDDSVIARGVFANDIVLLQKPIASADLAQRVRAVLDAGNPSF